MAIKKVLEARKKNAQLDRLQSYKTDMRKVLDRMEVEGDCPVLHEHMHSFIGEVESEMIEILDGGIVEKK
jgi:hypothetical protein